MPHKALAAVTAALLTFSFAPAATAAPAAAGVVRTEAAPLPNHYIITLAKGGVIARILERFNIKAKFTFGELFLGFSAELSPLVASALKVLPEVESVQPDAEVKLVIPPGSGSARQAGSWGLDRINQRGLPLDGQFSTSRDGSGTTSFIVDTGIQFNHPEFGGRAVRGFDAIGDGRNGEDCNGHGTHVAGTVGGTQFGVAKRTRLVAVRVLGCDGRGSWSGIIAGMDWVAANAPKGSVANMSLGGTPAQSAVDLAADRLSDRGVFTAVAGGNSTDDACKYSPARANRPITIGATTRTDGFADYSNRGQCIQLLAPGTDITSAWPGSRVNTISGTSMATPHVAGVAALIKQTSPDASQSQIMQWLWQNATPNKIGGIPAATPNYLLYTGGL